MGCSFQGKKYDEEKQNAENFALYFSIFNERCKLEIHSAGFITARNGNMGEFQLYLGIN